VFFIDIFKKHKFFEKIIPLPHPRFIMQYRRKQAADYIQSYVDTLKGCLNQQLNS